jgi:hypothetical protein
MRTFLVLNYIKILYDIILRYTFIEREDQNDLDRRNERKCNFGRGT